MTGGNDAIATVQKIRPATRGSSTQTSVRAGKTTSAVRRSTSTHTASGAGELGSPRRTTVGASDDRPAMNGSDALMAKRVGLENITADRLSVEESPTIRVLYFSCWFNPLSSPL